MDWMSATFLARSQPLQFAEKVVFST